MAVLAGLVTQTVVARTVMDRVLMRAAQGYDLEAERVLDDVAWLLRDVERVAAYDRATRLLLVRGGRQQAAAQQAMRRVRDGLLPELLPTLERRGGYADVRNMRETVKELLRWRRDARG